MLPFLPRSRPSYSRMPCAPFARLEHGYRLNDSPIRKEEPMAQSVREVMTKDPVTIPLTAPVVEAAKLMQQHDVGDVIVMDDGQVCGIVTDRDIVVRAIADGKDPSATTLDEVCTRVL